MTSHDERDMHALEVASAMFFVLAAQATTPDAAKALHEAASRLARMRKERAEC